MIKYLEFSRYDEFGEHITPVNFSARNGDMVKTASDIQYSKEILDFVSKIKKDPSFYYVVMNGVGSSDYWGMNSNGDIFPESSLSHVSLPSDSMTLEDYGHKTFEYYGKFYKHHVNKNPKASFGDILFSYWNAMNHRVELVVAINMLSGKDIVDLLEAGEDVGVSMGCRVKYDLCSVCGNHAVKATDYCIHIKHYLRAIIDTATSALWSKQLGKTILPGTQVGMINERPVFFDISRVYTPADKTAHILGKVASDLRFTPSFALGDASGVLDSDIDKVANILKKGEIDKTIDPSAGSPDGQVIAKDVLQTYKGYVDTAASDQVSRDIDIPSEMLSVLGKGFGLNSSVNTMMDAGITLKPHEFQRLFLESRGMKALADELEGRKIYFNNINYPEPIEPVSLDGGNGVNAIAEILGSLVAARSSLPTTFTPERTARVVIIKTAADPIFTNADLAVAQSSLPILAAMASIYLGLKMKSSGTTMRSMLTASGAMPAVASLLGGGVLYQIAKNNAKTPDIFNIPASNYENILQSTNFSGHVKSAANAVKTVTSTIKNLSPDVKKSLSNAALTSMVAFPLAHFISSYNQSNIAQKGKPAGVLVHSLDNKGAPVSAVALSAALPLLKARF